jgi:predicted RNase H-like nuclease (RuvC/YqgF family)
MQTRQWKRKSNESKKERSIKRRLDPVQREKDRKGSRDRRKQAKIEREMMENEVAKLQEKIQKLKRTIEELLIEKREMIDRIEMLEEMVDWEHVNENENNEVDDEIQPETELITSTYNHRISEFYNETNVKYWTNLSMIDFENLVNQVTPFIENRTTRGGIRKKINWVSKSYTIRNGIFLTLF